MERAGAEQTYDRYAPIYDDWNSANDYESWLGRYLLPLLERHDLHRGSVLDIGCGTGRAFSPLLRRGWKVVGCDISQGMLSVAEKKYGDRVATFKADVRDLPAAAAAQYTSGSSGFELILMLNDVVNYLTGSKELEGALHGIRRILHETGGLLLFDANTLRLFRADYLSDVKDVRGAGWEWHGLSKEVEPGGIFQGRITGRGVQSHIHTQRHWTPVEVKSALENSNLRLRGVYGQHEEQGRLSLEECPDEDRDEKLIYIASSR